MGVKHAREYADILADLTNAIGTIADGFSFFEMEQQDWEALGDEERREVIEALADDVFFALEDLETIAVGSGSVTYRPQFHVIEVSSGAKEVHIVRLI